MDNLKIEELLSKVDKIRESEKVDLSSKEDLAIGIMNLISIEEHLYFSYKKTNDENFLTLLNEVREMRKNLLEKIVKNPKGEVWCISKHLLSGSMRFMEVGTKKLNENKKDEAKDFFEKAYQLWNIFWGLNLDLISAKDIDNSEMTNSNTMSFQNDNSEKKAEVSLFSKLGSAIQKMLNCCKE